MTSSHPLFKLDSITFTYEGQDSPVIEDFSLSVMEGESVGLTGPVGSGKTTTFHIGLGLLAPQSGSVWFNGRQITSEAGFKEMRKSAGLLFQNSEDQLFCPTVLQDVAFGPINLGYTTDEAIAQSRVILHELGLSGFEDRITYKLSGGEKKLVSLATILVMKPRLIFFDEPLNNLDEESSQKITRVIQELDTAKLIISHNHDFLATVTNRTVSVK